MRLWNIVIHISRSIHIAVLVPLVLIVKVVSFLLLFEQLFLRSILFSTDPVIDISPLLLEVTRDVIKPLIPSCIASLFESHYVFAQATPEGTLAVLANPAEVDTLLSNLTRHLMLRL